MAEALLRIEGLTQRFGGITAVDGLSMSVDPGELFGIIGPNGAGKSTLLNCISGVYRDMTGRVLLGTQALHKLRPHRIAMAGVGRTFQAADSFSDFTTLDYVLMGRLRYQQRSLVATMLHTPRVLRSEKAEKHQAMDVLDRLDLARVAGESLAKLPYGQRKLVDVVRVLMQNPRLVLLDEPTSGTTMEDRSALRALLGEIREQGVTTVVVDHDVQFIATTCDRLLAMNFGRELGTDSPQELLKRKEVVEAYVGLEGD